MWRYLSLTAVGALANSQFQPNNDWMPPQPAPVVYDPMMMMMLMGFGSEGSSSFKDMLPFMMMNGAEGGMAMDPMTMMMLMGSNSNSDSSSTTNKFKDLLPILMMTGGQMNPQVMMMLMANLSDDSSDTSGSKLSDLLPLMMMNPGGSGGMPMDPLMMTMLMGSGSDSSSSSNLKDLLPLMMMQNPQTGSTMDPMMLMALLEDEGEDSLCEITHQPLKDLDISTSLKQEIAIGEKIWTGSDVFANDELMDNNDFLGFIDYKYIACQQLVRPKDSGSGLLPLMMLSGMNGMNGPAGQIDPMMLAMLEGGSASDMLPFLMLQNNPEGAMNNPLLMLSLLGETDKEDKSKEACNKKFNMYIFESVTIVDGLDLKWKLHKVTDELEIQNVFADTDTDDIVPEYSACLREATSERSEISESDTGLKDLLPLMMMNGGAMDPMAMLMMGL